MYKCISCLLYVKQIVEMPKFQSNFNLKWLYDMMTDDM